MDDKDKPGFFVFGPFLLEFVKKGFSNSFFTKVGYVARREDDFEAEVVLHDNGLFYFFKKQSRQVGERFLFGAW